MLSFSILGAAHAADVTGARIIGADKEPQNWLSNGRTYSEQRFSPLEGINTSNVDQLGLTWFARHQEPDRARARSDADRRRRHHLYSGAWSHVLALEAKTGKLLWEFDPKVPGAHAARGCCDVVNRGVAVWGGKVFVGTYDGRLIALDAKSGSDGVGGADRRSGARLHHHRRAARREGQGHHRQWRRRIRRARLHHGL